MQITSEKKQNVKRELQKSLPKIIITRTSVTLNDYWQWLQWLHILLLTDDRMVLLTVKRPEAVMMVWEFCTWDIKKVIYAHTTSLYQCKSSDSIKVNQY